MSNSIISESPILAFAHIPKTAGTTLTDLLRRHFGTQLMAARSRPDSHWSTYRYTDLAQDLKIYPRLRCITGHCIKPFEDFGKVNSRLRWFTFLRDPQSRFISHYVHQQTGSHDHHKLELNTWASKLNRRNWMTRMIAGEEDLEAAKQIIQDKQIVLCLTEKFDESLNLLSRHYNLAGLATPPKRSLMVSRSSFIADQILSDLPRYQATIDENNSLDQKLYDFAKQEVWPKQVKTMEAAQAAAPGPNSFLQSYNRFAYLLKDKLLYAPYVRFSSKRQTS